MNTTQNDRVWELWRQDDNGNKMLIKEFASEAEALSLKQEFEDRGHKQCYWIEVKEKR